MDYKNFLILGGSGFVGTHLTQALVAIGAKVCIPTRRSINARHLKLLPTVDIVECDIHKPQYLASLMAGQEVVINLTGILRGRGRDAASRFNQVHAELQRKVAVVATRSQVKRLLSLSALGASSQAPSDYLRSKALGESLLRGNAGKIPVTVLRPSVIFGPGDSFLNPLAHLLSVLPVFPLAHAHSRIQPVYIKDVVATLIAALHHDHGEHTYELGGPKIYTLKELVTYVGTVTHHKPWIIPLPHNLGLLQTWAMRFLPGDPQSRDNVCREVPHLPFGLTATPLEHIAPAMLNKNYLTSEYQHIRTHAGR